MKSSNLTVRDIPAHFVLLQFMDGHNDIYSYIGAHLNQDHTHLFVEYGDSDILTVVGSNYLTLNSSASIIYSI